MTSLRLGQWHINTGIPCQQFQFIILAIEEMCQWVGSLQNKIECSHGGFSLNDSVERRHKDLKVFPPCVCDLFKWDYKRFTEFVKLV